MYVIHHIIMNISHLCKEVWDLLPHWHVLTLISVRYDELSMTLANNLECPFSDANSFNFSMYCWASFSVIPVSLEHVASVHHLSPSHCFHCQQECPVGAFPSRPGCCRWPLPPCWQCPEGCIRRSPVHVLTVRGGCHHLLHCRCHFLTVVHPLCRTHTF